MTKATEFQGSMTETVAGGNWDPSQLTRTDAAMEAVWIDQIESLLAQRAQATGNAHSVTGDYGMGRIYND